jgi:hypothetical protein
MYFQANRVLVQSAVEVGYHQIQASVVIDMPALAHDSEALPQEVCFRRMLDCAEDRLRDGDAEQGERRESIESMLLLPRFATYFGSARRFE